MTDHIKALITTYGAACARVARAPRLSPAQDEALRLERVAHDALVAEIDALTRVATDALRQSTIGAAWVPQPHVATDTIRQSIKGTS